MTHSGKLALGIVLASATMTVMAGSIIAPVLNQMKDGLGIEPSSVGLIITTHGLFMALSSPLMGILIDRMGVKRPYIAGLFGYGLFGGAGMLIDSFWVLLFSRALLGMALALVFTSITVWILNTYDGAERNKIMGWRGSAQSLGGTIWPLIGGALGALSWHLPCQVIVMIAAAFWCAALASLSLSGNIPMIVFSVIIFGIGNGLMMPSAMVWLGSVVPPSFRGRLGSYLGTLGFMGQFLSPVLFAPVLVLLGLEGVFRIGAGIGAAWFLLILSGILFNVRSSQV